MAFTPGVPGQALSPASAKSLIAQLQAQGPAVNPAASAPRQDQSQEQMLARVRVRKSIEMARDNEMDPSKKHIYDSMHGIVMQMIAGADGPSIMQFAQSTFAPPPMPMPQQGFPQPGAPGAMGGGPPAAAPPMPGAMPPMAQAAP